MLCKLYSATAFVKTTFMESDPFLLRQQRRLVNGHMETTELHVTNGLPVRTIASIWTSDYCEPVTSRGGNVGAVFSTWMWGGRGEQILNDTPLKKQVAWGIWCLRRENCWCFFCFLILLLLFFFFNIQTTTYSYRFNDGYFAHLSL